MARPSADGEPDDCASTAAHTRGTNRNGTTRRVDTTESKIDHNLARVESAGMQPLPVSCLRVFVVAFALLAGPVRVSGPVLVAATGARAQTQRLPQPGVRYVPSPQSVVDAMLELAHVTSTDVVYDLGSGDGRIPITAAQRYGARGFGVEIERRLVAEATSQAARAHVSDRVTFVHGDLFETDIRPA